MTAEQFARTIFSAHSTVDFKSEDGWFIYGLNLEHDAVVITARGKNWEIPRELIAKVHTPEAQ